MKKIFTTLIFLLCTAQCIWGSQQLETVVFPSEDEIAEAFALGEISFEQFIILTELITNQIEPTSFLLDEIPHSLLRFKTPITHSQDIIQTQYFLTQNLSKNITIRNQYASYLDEDTPTRYQSSIMYKNREFKINLIAKKEYSGRERFTRRYLEYRPENQNLTVIVGNFTKRFGLGGIVGYRGRLLSYSDNLNTESLLFPDYGGFNGVYLQTATNKLSMQIASSYIRNDISSILSNILMLQQKNNKLPAIIIGVHRIENRNTYKHFNDYKASLYKKYSYTNGYLSTELIGEKNIQNKSSALLFDGKHKTQKVQATYSFWKYGKSFINISGGSKTSLISERIFIDDIQDTILSKRSNQTGGVFKTKIQLSTTIHLNIASLYAYKNRDTTEMQVFTQVSKKLFNSSKLSVDLLYRVKERIETITDISKIKYQYRLMLVQEYENFYFRNYLLALHKTDDPSYVGLFSEIKYRSLNYGLIHLWLNFSRFNQITNQFDYVYLFIKNKFNLYNSLSLSFKLSHRYNRTASDKIRNQFSLDVSWQI